MVNKKVGLRLFIKYLPRTDVISSAKRTGLLTQNWEGDDLLGQLLAVPGKIMKKYLTQFCLRLL